MKQGYHQQLFTFIVFCTMGLMIGLNDGCDDGCDDCDAINNSICKQHPKNNEIQKSCIIIIGFVRCFRIFLCGKIASAEEKEEKSFITYE